jgi:hypothetical protein
VSSDTADGELDQPVDGPVGLGDGEQEGDPDEHDEDVAGEPGEDVVGGQPGGEHADQESSRERERPHVDGERRRDDEDDNENQNGNELNRHRFLLFRRCANVIFSLFR